MLQKDIVAFINELEREFPVESWKVEGVHSWPILRFKLRGILTSRYSTMFDSQASSAAHTIHHGIWSVALNRVRELLNGSLRYRSALKNDHLMNAPRPNGSEHIVFLSDGVSFLRRQGRWFEKFCDPLRVTLEEGGFKTFMFTQFRTYLYPRYLSSKFMQPKVDGILLMGMLGGRYVLRSRVQSWPGWKAFAERVDGRFPGIGTYLARWAPLDLWVTLRLRDYFKRELIQLKAKGGFCVNYYNREGTAFVLACRELGIPSVDIQHGVQGETHVAYGKWERVPPSGYAMLPSHFWCWNQDSADAVQSWAKGGTAHMAIVGGNPMLHAFTNGADFNQDTLAVKKIQNGQAEKLHILYTLSGLEGAETLGSILRLVEKSLDRCCWWIRLHPTAIERKDEIRALVAHLPPEEVIVDAATDLPLFSVLACVDLHVTEVSSTVLEAEQFGIRSVVMHEDAIYCFPRQIETGMAVLQQTELDVLSEISKASERKKCGAGGAKLQVPDLKAVLASILGQ